MKALSFLAASLVTAALVFSNPAIAQGTLKVAVPSNVNTLDPAKTKIGEEYIVNFPRLFGSNGTR